MLFVGVSPYSIPPTLTVGPRQHPRLDLAAHERGDLGKDLEGEEGVHGDADFPDSRLWIVVPEPDRRGCDDAKVHCLGHRTERVGLDEAKQRSAEGHRLQPDQQRARPRGPFGQARRSGALRGRARRRGRGSSGHVLDNNAAALDDHAKVAKPDEGEEHEENAARERGGRDLPVPDCCQDHAREVQSVDGVVVLEGREAERPEGEEDGAEEEELRGVVDRRVVLRRCWVVEGVVVVGWLAGGEAGELDAIGGEAGEHGAWRSFGDAVCSALPSVRSALLRIVSAK